MADIKKISKELDSLPLGLSDYELNTFINSSEITPARHLVSMMLEIEQLGLILNTESSDHRQIKVIEQKYKKLCKWYTSLDAKYVADTLKNYEKEESEYWVNFLGRRAAIELLTLKSTTVETMDKMAQLPPEDFEECVKICVRFSNMIKNSTSQAEDSVLNRTSGTPKK